VDGIPGGLGVHTIVAEGRHPYPIYVGRGILNDTAVLLHRGLEGEKHRDPHVLIVTDRNVSRHHLRPLEGSLREGGFIVSSLVMKAGERLKRSSELYRALRAMVQHGLTRDATVFALGGGVIGDLAGFAASVYMRGCRLVQVPTTLLAQVDSAIGGKVGINLPEGKNLVGAFYTPLFVLSDTQTLATLPERELGSGLAEVIKYGLIEDAGLFGRIERFFSEPARGAAGPLEAGTIRAALLDDQEFLRHIVLTSARIKAAIVADDELEQGRRMILNFGHTFGHALEQVTGYRRYLHGEAVFLGMDMAVRLSSSLGLLGGEEARRALELLGRFRVPGVRGISSSAVLARMGADKKKRGGSIHYVVLEAIGRAVTKAGIREELVKACIDDVLSARTHV
jgi:3-dehydroquinate synthase